jgi:hypothetical protein
MSVIVSTIHKVAAGGTFTSTHLRRLPGYSAPVWREISHTVCWLQKKVNGTFCMSEVYYRYDPMVFQLDGHDVRHINDHYL